MTNTDIPHIDRVIGGFTIIRKYTTDTWITAEHDVIYFGNYEETRRRMSKDERTQMKLYGWFEEYDSWAIYT